jgi:hypothetical protein
MDSFSQWLEAGVIEDAPKGTRHEEISHFYNDNKELVRVYAVLEDGRLTGAYETWFSGEWSTRPSYRTIFGKASPPPDPLAN